MMVGTLLGILAVGPSGAGSPPASQRMQPDHAPTPFTAAQIRAGCPTGSWRTYRISVLGPQGWSVTQRDMRFVRSDDDGTDMRAVQRDSEGRELGEPLEVHTRWTELQSHGSFPRTDTWIEDVPVRLDCGSFDTWLYLVVTSENGRTKEKRLWFARHLPGPPVVMEEWLDQELVLRMTLVDFGPRPTTPDSR
jgi:hypothetical protein